MVFLIAVTSARRVSEIGALSIDPAFCVFRKESVLLRLDPTFLPKSSSLSPGPGGGSPLLLPQAPARSGASVAYVVCSTTLVVKQKLPGVYVQPSYQSALMWFGVIFIRHGLYQDGVFKFTVYIPDNYPDGDCPRLVFDLPVFHPLVDPLSGELDVKRAFAKWRRNHNHIWQVLMYARRVFYKIDTTTFSLNYLGCIFKSLKIISTWVFALLDPYDFSPWNPAIHDEAREKMLSQKKKPEDQQCKSMQVSGLSWVKPGSVQPFSKEEKTLPT
uniref:AKT interacting protein n=1 Tax=Sphenodon punctatus TaxID=8508 RepID=A0A8D0HP65_SPHPU